MMRYVWKGYSGVKIRQNARYSPKFIVRVVLHEETEMCRWCAQRWSLENLRWLRYLGSVQLL